MKLTLKLKEFRFVPAAMIASFGIYNAISFSAIEMMTLSYMSLAVMLAMFLVSCYLLADEPSLTIFDFAVLTMVMLILIVSLISDTDFKDWIYQGCSILLLVFLLRYYRDNLSPLLIGAVVAFSLAVYAGFFQLLRHPEMWIVEEAKLTRGYLLGNNYNQMGCRLIAAVITNILCLRISRWFWVNLIPLLASSFGILVIVHSTTSLSCLLLLVFICLFPSLRLQRWGTSALMVGILLFEVFVCFQGNRLQDNEFARWLVIDVMDKDLTFTNRTYLWDAAIQCFAKSPVWGYGYVDADWFVANMTSRAVGPHNMILAVMIYGGVIALVLYFYTMWTAFRRVWSVEGRVANSVYAAIVVLSLTMLMEYFPLPFYFYMLALAYYYPEFHRQTTEEPAEE